MLLNVQSHAARGAHDVAHGAFEIGFAADSLTRQKSRPGKRIVRYYRTTILNPTKTTDSVPLVLTKDYYKESYAAIRLAGTAGIYESITQFNPIRVTTIDSLWGLHLRHEGIHNAHFVDELFGRDTVIDTSRPKTLEPTRLLQTRRVSTSMSEDYGLRGYIVDASGIIYRRMFLAGGATLLLALIATTCYAYLIRTILRQKSIAQIKNDFVNNMTHELKTPITVTYSAIDTLQTYNLIDDKAKRDEYLTLCKQELKHLTRLVEKILSMAVDERKTLRLHKEAFQPRPLIDQLTRQIALKTGKQVHFRIIDELDGRPIVADKLYLGQAIENLIDNAVKYAGPEPHVTIRLKTDNATEIPKCFRGFPITLVTAAIMAMAFAGFSGLRPALSDLKFTKKNDESVQSRQESVQSRQESVQGLLEFAEITFYLRPGTCEPRHSRSY